MPTIHLNVCTGVHSVVHAHTNCYVVEGNDGVTLVDAAYPSTWRAVERCLASINRSVDDVRGLVLTHGHFDHLGFARFVQRDLGIEVWGHPADRPIFEHPYRYRPERPRLLYPVAYPRAVPVLTQMLVAGALRVPGVQPDHDLVEQETLPLPGQPRVLYTPGHTDGECALLLPERDAMLTGDALVTLDPYTGLTGPRIIARAATTDAGQALRSLDKLAAESARHVLTGHGRPWHDSIRTAVRLARSTGGR